MRNVRLKRCVSASMVCCCGAKEIYWMPATSLQMLYQTNLATFENWRITCFLTGRRLAEQTTEHTQPGHAQTRCQWRNYNQCLTIMSVARHPTQETLFWLSLRHTGWWLRGIRGKNTGHRTFVHYRMTTSLLQNGTTINSSKVWLTYRVNATSPVKSAW